MHPVVQVSFQMIPEAVRVQMRQIQFLGVASTKEQGQICDTYVICCHISSLERPGTNGARGFSREGRTCFCAIFDPEGRLNLPRH